jgi:hypothetical protein
LGSSLDAQISSDYSGYHYLSNGRLLSFARMDYFRISLKSKDTLIYATGGLSWTGAPSFPARWALFAAMERVG